MAITIKYNNFNPFGARPPLISREEDYVYTPGGVGHRVDTFILEGKLSRTDCSDGFNSIFSLTKSLILAFAENFKKFEILENSQTIFSYNYAIVESISFDENKYINLVPYTIRLRCLRDKFADIYGIVDPSDNYEFSEEEGCIIQVTRTISCRGIVNSNDAITNAKNFISSKQAYLPEFTPSYGVVSPILVDQQESRNNNTAQVSLTQVFRYDKSNLSGNSSFIQTRIIEQKIDNGVFTVNISGEVQAGINSDMSAIRTFMSSVRNSSDVSALAEYLSYNPSGIFLSQPVEATISENQDTKTISYSFTYSDEAASDPYILDTTTISRSNGKDCISCEIIIKSLIGCPATRYSKTKSYLDSFDVDSYVNVRWVLYGYSSKLSTVPQSKSISVNSQTGEIVLSISYCSDTREDCGCLESFDYELEFTEPIPQFSEAASYQGAGCYSIQNLKYNNRAKFEISGSCKPSKCCSVEAAMSQVKTRANQLMVEYFPASDIVLDRISMEYSENLGVISFNFGWNGIKALSISNSIIYGTGTSVSKILLESGGAILLEDGGYLLLE